MPASGSFLLLWLAKSLPITASWKRLRQGETGVVVLAEDTRQGHRVALKVLPPGFAGDPQRGGTAYLANHDLALDGERFLAPGA